MAKKRAVLLALCIRNGGGLIDVMLHNVPSINPPPFLITLLSLAIILELIPLELINSKRDAIRKAREAFLIYKSKTLEPSGMNRRDEI